MIDKLNPLVLWAQKRQLPSALDLARIALTPIEEIQKTKHPDDLTQDAWAIAIALRVLYLRTIASDEYQGVDSEVILADRKRTEFVSYIFIGERLKGLESIIREMAMQIIGDSRK
ncbi:hypothetical protein EH221_04470 [bacterium]|nr:MAG: hypothetical protein EH221_04470 [bacterium]